MMTRMKKSFLALSAITLLALAGCAPSAPSATPVEPVETHVSAEPTPTETHTPERAEFSDASVALDDLLAVAERGDVPVVLLPKVVGATVTITGSSGTYTVVMSNYAPDISRDAEDNIVITPEVTAGGELSTHSGALSIELRDGSSFTIEIEGVDP